MALAMHHLLRLPPTLRCQVLSNASFLARPLENHQYQNGARLILRRSYAQAKFPPKPTVRKPSAVAPPAPSPRPLPAKKHATGNPYADRLCHDAEQVLIYNSPRHTAYAITSYVFGAILLLGATTTAALTKAPTATQSPPGAPETPVRIPWWVRACVLVPAVAFATLGFVVIIAPTKIIRRIWLLRPQQQQQQQQHGHFGPPPSSPSYAFKIEVKSALLYRNGRTITTPITNVAIDRHVQSQDLSWHNVPLSSAAAFTNHFLPATHPSHLRGTPTPPTLTSRLKGFNSSLLNAWPSFQRNVKRMFVREGIAYVHIVGENGQWKLDMQDAEVLDGARPLSQLMVTDVQMAKGMVPWMQRVAAMIQSATGR